MAAPAFHVELHAPPRILDAAGAGIDVPVGKSFALLVFLALHPEGVRREEIIEVFWPGRAPGRSRGSLRQALWLLRKHLGADLVEGEELLHIAPGRLDTTVTRLERALEEGATDEALACWGDMELDALRVPGSPAWDHWMEGLRSDLEQRLLLHLTREARDLLSRGAHEEGLARAVAAHGVAPWSELPGHLRFEALLGLRRLDEAEALALEVEDPGERAERLRMVRTLRASEPVGPAGVGEGNGLPFVGRGAEQARLTALWRGSREGSVRRALVLGPPGIGKSRLVQEAARSAESEGARMVRVKGSRATAAVSLAATSELARRLLGMAGAAGITLASHRTLLELLPSMAGTGDAPARPSPPARGPDARLVDALRDLISAVAEEGPLLLVLDDLGWFDPGSQAVILHALEGLDAVPLLVLATDGEAGPEAPGAWDLELTLPPLAPEATRSLLRSLVEPEGPRRDGDPEDSRWSLLASRVHEASGGLPLPLLELLGVLERRGHLERTASGSYRLRTDGPEGALDLPSGLSGVVAETLSHLSPTAARLAGHLALAPGPLDREELLHPFGLRRTALHRALAELLKGRVCRWTDDGRVDFAHDELRSAARLRFAVETRGHLRRIRVRTGFGAAALVFLLVVAGLVHAANGNAPVSTPPPLGGGSLLLQAGGSFAELLPAEAPVGTWETRPLAPPPAPPGARLDPPFRGADGALLWFGWMSSTEEKPWISLVGANGSEEAFRSEGDDYLQDVSPDGRVLLLTSQPMDGPEGYRLNLVLHPLGGGPTTLLHEGVDRIDLGRFSRDGTRIAARIAAPEDTLAVFTPTGTMAQALQVGKIDDLAWCGSRELVALVDDPSGDRLIRVDTDSGGIRPLPQVGYPIRPVACSPDGSALVYATALEGDLAVILHDLEAGTWESVEVPDGDLSHFRWAPEAPVPVPEALELHLEGPVGWGESGRPIAYLVFSDGHRTPLEDGVTWHSGDPRIASVGPQGRVRGNAPGATTLRATWDGWLEAAVEVEVSGTRPDALRLEDPFRTLDLGRWVQVGHPPARIVERDGTSVLLLEGDALYHDGLITREAHAFPRGVTVELEFRLPVNRRDKQWLFVCLVDGDLPDDPDAGFEYGDLQLRQRSCFRYPNTNLGNFDASKGILFARHQAVRTLDLSRHLPSDDWVHLTLEMRADGRTSAYLDREYVGTAPLHAANTPGSRWRILLFGTTWETETLVRNLVVWDGIRP